MSVFYFKTKRKKKRKNSKH